MKPVQSDKLKQLLQIVGPYPSTSVAHFSDMDIAFSKTVYEYCKERDYSYQLNCTDPSFYTQANETFTGCDGIRTIDFSLNRPRYIIQGKTYEFVFVTVDFSKVSRDLFLKKTHEILRNAGNIILFLPKMSNAVRYEWEKLLEENYYVATNTINDLFEGFDVLISKKMHGWGDK